MPRIAHGMAVSLEAVQAAIGAIDALNSSLATPILVAAPRRLTEFGYLFDLQDNPDNLLPAGPDGLTTIANLIKLGDTMRDPTPNDDDGNNADIPAAYTYLGQFIDHDITLEILSDTLGNLDDPKVLSSEEVLQRIKNQRTATLDLDSVYDPPAPLDGQRMKLGQVSPEGHPVPGKDKDHDLPRAGRDPVKPELDRFALIGDARNDENLVVAQLHVAFLRLHNEIVKTGHTWDSARQIVRQLYQWIVVNDFLRKVSGDAIVDDILTNGNRFFVPSDKSFFMPLEFSVAAFRFGHSMVRERYDFNVNFGSNGIQDSGLLKFLFTFTALTGQLGLPGGDFDTLPENWVIQWENFVNSAPNPTRKIDTRLVEPLFELRNVDGVPFQGIPARLAVRNLLRGYKLRMPTGQAVADTMNRVNPAITRLTPAEILDAAANPEQRQVLEESGFADRTPLWFYILAEAQARTKGKHLGLVGGTIVAEVLIGLVRRSADSIFDLGKAWNPSQLSGQLEREINRDVNLSDLFHLAGVL